MKYLLILVASLLLISCVPSPEGEEIKGTYFELIEIKGMPCIYGKIGHGAVLTYDWTKFDPSK